MHVTQRSKALSLLLSLLLLINCVTPVLAEEPAEPSQAPDTQIYAVGTDKQTLQSLGEITVYPEKSNYIQELDSQNFATIQGKSMTHVLYYNSSNNGTTLVPIPNGQLSDEVRYYIQERGLYVLFSQYAYNYEVPVIVMNAVATPNEVQYVLAYGNSYDEFMSDLHTKTTHRDYTTLEDEYYYCTGTGFDVVSSFDDIDTALSRQSNAYLWVECKQQTDNMPLSKNFNLVATDNSAVVKSAVELRYSNAMAYNSMMVSLMSFAPAVSIGGYNLYTKYLYSDINCANRITTKEQLLALDTVYVRYSAYNIVDNYHTVGQAITVTANVSTSSAYASYLPELTSTYYITEIDVSDSVTSQELAQKFYDSLGLPTAYYNLGTITEQFLTNFRSRNNETVSIPVVRNNAPVIDTGVGNNITCLIGSYVDYVPTLLTSNSNLVPAYNVNNMAITSSPQQFTNYTLVQEGNALRIRATAASTIPVVVYETYDGMPVCDPVLVNVKVSVDVNSNNIHENDRITLRPLVNNTEPEEGTYTYNYTVLKSDLSITTTLESMQSKFVSAIGTLRYLSANGNLYYKNNNGGFTKLNDIQEWWDGGYTTIYVGYDVNNFPTYQKSYNIDATDTGTDTLGIAYSTTSTYMLSTVWYYNDVQITTESVSTPYADLQLSNLDASKLIITGTHTGTIPNLTVTINMSGIPMVIKEPITINIFASDIVDTNLKAGDTITVHSMIDSEFSATATYRLTDADIAVTTTLDQMIAKFETAAGSKPYCTQEHKLYFKKGLTYSEVTSVVDFWKADPTDVYVKYIVGALPAITQEYTVGIGQIIQIRNPEIDELQNGISLKWLYDGKEVTSSETNVNNVMTIRLADGVLIVRGTAVGFSQSLVSIGIFYDGVQLASKIITLTVTEESVTPSEGYARNVGDVIKIHPYVNGQVPQGSDFVYSYTLVENDLVNANLDSLIVNMKSAFPADAMFSPTNYVFVRNPSFKRVTDVIDILNSDSDVYIQSAVSKAPQLVREYGVNINSTSTETPIALAFRSYAADYNQVWTYNNSPLSASTNTSIGILKATTSGISITPSKPGVLEGLAVSLNLGGIPIVQNVPITIYTFDKFYGDYAWQINVDWNTLQEEDKFQVSKEIPVDVTIFKYTANTVAVCNSATISRILVQECVGDEVHGTFYDNQSPSSSTITVPVKGTEVGEYTVKFQYYISGSTMPVSFSLPMTVTELKAESVDVTFALGIGSWKTVPQQVTVSLTESKPGSGIKLPEDTLKYYTKCYNDIITVNGNAMYFSGDSYTVTKVSNPKETSIFKSDIDLLSYASDIVLTPNYERITVNISEDSLSSLEYDEDDSSYYWPINGVTRVEQIILSATTNAPYTDTEYVYTLGSQDHFTITGNKLRLTHDRSEVIEKRVTETLNVSALHNGQVFATSTIPVVFVLVNDSAVEERESMRLAAANNFSRAFPDGVVYVIKQNYENNAKIKDIDFIYEYNHSNINPAYTGYFKWDPQFENISINKYQGLTSIPMFYTNDGNTITTYAFNLSVVFIDITLESHLETYTLDASQSQDSIIQTVSVHFNGAPNLPYSIQQMLFTEMQSLRSENSFSPEGVVTSIQNDGESFSRFILVNPSEVKKTSKVKVKTFTDHFTRRITIPEFTLTIVPSRNTISLDDKLTVQAETNTTVELSNTVYNEEESKVGYVVLSEPRYVSITGTFQNIPAENTTLLLSTNNKNSISDLEVTDFDGTTKKFKISFSVNQPGQSVITISTNEKIKSTTYLVINAYDREFSISEFAREYSYDVNSKQAYATVYGDVGLVLSGVAEVKDDAPVVLSSRGGLTENDVIDTTIKIVSVDNSDPELPVYKVAAIKNNEALKRHKFYIRSKCTYGDDEQNYIYTPALYLTVEDKAKNFKIPAKQTKNINLLNTVAYQSAEFSVNPNTAISSVSLDKDSAKLFNVSFDSISKIVLTPKTRITEAKTVKFQFALDDYTNTITTQAKVNTTKSAPTFKLSSSSATLYISSKLAKPITQAKFTLLRNNEKVDSALAPKLVFNSTNDTTKYYNLVDSLASDGTFAIELKSTKDFKNLSGKTLLYSDASIVDPIPISLSVKVNNSIDEFDKLQLAVSKKSLNLNVYAIGGIVPDSTSFSVSLKDNAGLALDDIKVEDATTYKNAIHTKLSRIMSVTRNGNSIQIGIDDTQVRYASAGNFVAGTYKLNIIGYINGNPTKPYPISLKITKKNPADIVKITKSGNIDITKADSTWITEKVNLGTLNGTVTGIELLTNTGNLFTSSPAENNSTNVYLIAPGKSHLLKKYDLRSYITVSCNGESYTVTPTKKNQSGLDAVKLKQTNPSFEVYVGSKKSSTLTTQGLNHDPNISTNFIVLGKVGKSYHAIDPRSSYCIIKGKVATKLDVYITPTSVYITPTEFLKKGTYTIDLYLKVLDSAADSKLKKTTVKYVIK